MSEQITTVLIKVEPQQDVELMNFYQETVKLKNYAEARIIATTEDIKLASDDLNLIRRLKKAIEAKRRDFLQPFQDYIKNINGTFKTLVEPIEAADKITSEKMLAFTAEHDRIRREQERINAERIKLAEAEMKLNGELSESVKLVEVIPPVATTTRTELGSTGLRDHWVFEVVDFALLPDEYKIPDAVKLGKVVRAGLHSINGVKIWNEPILAVGK